MNKVHKALNTIFQYSYPGSTENLLLVLTTNRKLIFVEGQFNFNHFYPIVDDTKARVVLPKLEANNKNEKFGREGVCKAINFFTGLKEKFNGIDLTSRVCGICDKDLLAFGYGEHGIECVLLTDYHDIEIDALHYSDTKTFFSGKINPRSMRPENVLNCALKLCEPIGLVRLISEERGWGIKFGKIDFNYKKNKKEGQVCDANFTPNIKEIVRRLLNQNLKSRQYSKNLEDLTVEVQKRIGQYDLKDICQGHDVLWAIGLIMKVYPAYNQSGNANENDLNASILSNYHLQYFLESNLGKQLNEMGFLLKEEDIF